MNSEKTVENVGFNLKGWAITLVGALFFFYAFFQVNMMTALNNDLHLDFGASSAEIGLLSAWCFYANVIFLIPAGLILDRFSVRKILLVNMLIAVAGTLIFAFSTSLAVAGIGRFVTGIMLAFGLVACLKLASLWLPPKSMALASSLVVTIGMIGGLVSQAPMTMLAARYGWRGAAIAVAVFGLVLAALLWIVVHDPVSIKRGPKEKVSVWKSLSMAIREPQNWFCGFFTSLLNLPVAVLGALFGITYLMHVYGFSSVIAASVTSMLFFGMIFGSPFFGWLSDFMRIRRLPMLIGAIVCLVLIVVAIYVQNLNLAILHLLFFLVGFTSGAQVLGYPVIAESNSPKLTGTALSFSSIIIMGGGYGLGLPFVGWLLDLGWKGEMVGGVHSYSVEAYRYAFLSIPIGIVLSLVMIFFMKETNCKALKQNEEGIN